MTLRMLSVVIAACLVAGVAPAAMNLVRATTRTDEAVARYGVTGRGVTIAIADRGIDWRHPDFIKPDGTTRIKWLLDMSDQQGPCPGNPPPKEYSEAQINLALAGGPPVPSDDFHGHGTITAGLAAGNGRAFAGGKYRGMAPEADLIIVKAACFDDALEWMYSKIETLRQPAVLTFNFGVQWGPMDGTDSFSRRLDQLFGLDRPGRVFVSPPGGEGGIPDHAAGPFNAATETVIPIRHTDSSSASANMWLTGSSPAEVSVTFDDGTAIGPVGPNSNQSRNGLSIWHYDLGRDPWQSTSGDRAVIISLDKPPGTGTVRVRGLSSRDGRFDIYGSSTLTFSAYLAPGRLTSMASAKGAIVPAVEVNRENALDIQGIRRACVFDGERAGGLWVNSPGGPLRDGRLGVDVAVPGHCAYAAYGQNSLWRRSPWLLIEDGGSWYGSGGGGSGAGPVMTGAVALMLQLRPTLTARQIKQVLHDTAVRDAATGATPNLNWGFGKLDMVRALDAISALSSRAPGAPRNLIGSATGTTIALNWQSPGAGGAPTSYIVEAAVVPGGAVIASAPAAGTALVVPNVPTGVYYIRARAVNGDGTSAPSNEVIVTVPGGGGRCEMPPNPPQMLIGSVSGTFVSLNWTPPTGSCAATGYLLQAGSAPGLSNIAVVGLGPQTVLSANVPPGTYYVRVLSVNSFGSSGPSNEAIVTAGPQ